MDNNNNNSGNKFFSGFLLGVLVGAGVMFLFGTKKGKKLLKAISEEGVGKISDILEEAEKTEDLDEVATDTKAMVNKSEGQGRKYTPREFAIKERSVEEKPKVRRFFKGISRHVN